MGGWKSCLCLVVRRDSADSEAQLGNTLGPENPQQCLPTSMKVTLSRTYRLYFFRLWRMSLTFFLFLIQG